MSDATEHDDGWYWDLERNEAVPASQRRLASNTLGPYRSRAEAENWQQTVESRNDEWDDADDDWNDCDDTGTEAT